jgi:4-oxalocrotonate tautomerase
MTLLDAYHDQLKDAVGHATERGFARSWGEDGLPQVKVLVGPRDEHERPECLLVLRAQAAFDFAWRMYDWAMGQKRDAERARDGSAPSALARKFPVRRATRVSKTACGYRVSMTTTNQRRSAMPLINVKLIEDVFTSEQKGQIIERLTDAMVSIEGENMRGVTWVLVEEVHSGDWGIGGKPLSTDDIKALAAGTPA